MVHHNDKPPKLVLPTSAAMKWNRVFLACSALLLLVFLGPVVLYRFGYRPVGVAPIAPTAGSTASGLQRQSTASEAANLIAGNAAIEPATTGSRLISLKHEGAIINTAFGEGWSLNMNDDQAIISNDERGAVCQSVLLSVAEYSAMMQSANGNHLEVMRALLGLQVEMLAKTGVTASVTAEMLFEEKAPNERFGLVGKVTIPAASRTIPTYLAYVVKAPHVASLTCSTVGPALDPVEAVRWLTTYDFKN